MTRRHLALAEAERTLAAGRAVEQWLGATDSELGPVIRFVACTKRSDESFVVTLHRKIVPSSFISLDIYALESADLDQPPSVHCDAAKSALEAAIRNFGAREDRFVNSGVVQDEYADHRNKTGRENG